MESIMRPKNEERKSEVFAFVNSYVKEHGVAPTTQEICDHLGLAKSTVSKYMNRLIDDGLLEKYGRYRFVTAGNSSSFTKMPVVGRVACGKPILAVEDIEGYLPIDDASLGGGEFFGLIAEGDSMIEAGINDGDIVYIRRQSVADDGDIVVAIVPDEVSGEDSATLKRLYRDRKNKRFILHPENERLSDIVVETLRVVGVAVKVLKNLK